MSSHQGVFRRARVFPIVLLQDTEWNVSIGTAGGPLAGNNVPTLAYPLNASNGFLVTMFAWVAQTASALPFAAVATSGVRLPLIWLFYVGASLQP